MSDLPLSLRHAGEADKGFCLASWLRSYFRYWPPRAYFADARSWRQYVAHDRHGERVVTWAEQVYHREHGEVVRDAAQRSMLTVAFDRTAPDVLYGFVAIECTTLHYVYVAKVVRGQGVARALLDEARGTMFASHMTTRGAKIARALNLRYAPERAWPRTEERT